MKKLRSILQPLAVRLEQKLIRGHFSPNIVAGVERGLFFLKSLLGGTSQAASLLAARRLEGLGAHGAASKCYRAYLKDNPVDEKEWRRLIRCWFDTGQVQLAISELNRLVATQEERFLSLRAVAFAMSGDEGAARSDAGKVQALGFYDRECTALDLSEAFRVLGDYPAAEIVLCRAIEEIPASREVRLALAHLYRNTGRYHKALELLSKAMASDIWGEGFAELWRLLRGELKVYEDGFVPQIECAQEVETSERSVLHVLEMSLPDRMCGYSYRSQYILDEQQALGLAPSAVTRPGFGTALLDSRQTEVDYVHGIRIFRTGTRGSRNYRNHALDSYLASYAGAAALIAEEVRASLIHAHSNFKNGLVGYSISQALGLPFVYELRGLWEDTQVSLGVITESSDRYKYFRAMEDWCLRHADAIVTVSQALKDDVVSRGAPEEYVTVIPNGVDAARFGVAAPDKELQAKFGLQDRAVTLGYVGSLSRYEGLESLIRVMPELCHEFSAVKLVIIGDGQERARLEQISNDLGVDKQVLFLGHIPHDEIFRYYSLLDVIVLPRVDSRVARLVSPLKPFEAMAAGKVVIAPSFPVFKEFLSHGKTGLLYRAGEQDSLLEICREIVRRPELVSSIGKQAQEWVARERQWEALVARYIHVYEQARKRGARRLDSSLAA